MAVDLGPATGPIVPGQPYALPVAARFLYGAPGAGLTGKATLRLVQDDAPFPALDGYRIGLENETYAPDAKDTDLKDTDAQGHTTYAILIPRAPDTSLALKAAIDVVINDPSGHGSRAQTEIKLRPAGRLIGIKPLFKGRAVDAGTEAGFDIAAVDPDGRPRGDGGEAAAGARAAGLAAGDARQPGALRDGLARRTAATRVERADPGRRAAALRPETGLRPLSH